MLKNQSASHQRRRYRLSAPLWIVGPGKVFIFYQRTNHTAKEQLHIGGFKTKGPETLSLTPLPAWSKLRRDGADAMVGWPIILNLCSSVGSEHAEHFARLRTSQGLDVEVIPFEVPQWFDEFVVEAAIPQEMARTNPRFDPKLFIKVVDETTPGEAYEFGKWWRGWFGEMAVPGSGLIHEVR